MDERDDAQLRLEMALSATNMSHEPGVDWRGLAQVQFTMFGDYAPCSRNEWGPWADLQYPVPREQ